MSSWGRVRPDGRKRRDRTRPILHHRLVLRPELSAHHRHHQRWRCRAWPQRRSGERHRAEDQAAERWLGVLTTTDSEIIIRILATELTQNPDPIKAIRSTMKCLDGAYALVIMVGGRSSAQGTPGLRPLCLGKMENGYCLASESAVFDILQGEFVQDIAPGEIVGITPTGFTCNKSIRPCSHRTLHVRMGVLRPTGHHHGWAEVYDVRRSSVRLLLESTRRMPMWSSGPRLRKGQRAGLFAGVRHPIRGGLDEEPLCRADVHPSRAVQARGGVSLKLNPIRSTIRGSVWWWSTTP